MLRVINWVRCIDKRTRNEKASLFLFKTEVFLPLCGILNRALLWTSDAIVFSMQIPAMN